MKVPVTALPFRNTIEPEAEEYIESRDLTADVNEVLNRLPDYYVDIDVVAIDVVEEADEPETHGSIVFYITSPLERKDFNSASAQLLRDLRLHGSHELYLALGIIQD